jgi:hypothetical protein
VVVKGEEFFCLFFEMPGILGKCSTMEPYSQPSVKEREDSLGGEGSEIFWNYIGIMVAEHCDYNFMLYECLSFLKKSVNF